MKVGLTKFQNYTFDQKILILITLSAIVSLSLFEVLSLGFFLIFLYFLIDRRIKLSFDLLGLPLFFYLVPIFINNVFYVSGYFLKALDRVIAIVFYFYRFNFNNMDQKKLCEFLYDFYKILIFFGLILIPVVIIQYYRIGELSIFWGGKFKVGFFYSLFFLSSLALFLYSKRSIYLMPSLIFLLVVFFTTRRSILIGLLFTFIIVLYQCKFHIRLSKLKMYVIIIISVIFSIFIISGIFFYFSGVYFYQHKIGFELLSGKRHFDLDTLDKISSSRVRNALAGFEVIKRDITELNLKAILFGHGFFPGERLTPKPREGLCYESILIITEYIENGLFGLLVKFIIFFKIYKFLLSLNLSKRTDFLFIPLYSMISIYLIFSIFTLTWDPLLPLYLLFFRFVENAYQEGFFHRERHTS